MPFYRQLDLDAGAAVNLIIIASVFGIVFVGELPDKTAVASLVLGARYSPAWVLIGVWAAFAVHVVGARIAGSSPSSVISPRS